MAKKTFGLRDVGQFKLYEHRFHDKTEIFISKRINAQKIMRVKVTRKVADYIKVLPHSVFAEECQQRIEGSCMVCLRLK